MDRRTDRRKFIQGVLASSAILPLASPSLKSIIDDFLAEIRSRKGLYDFRIVDFRIVRDDTSPLDRINVRRLLNTVEKSLQECARHNLFTVDQAFK